VFDSPKQIEKKGPPAVVGVIILVLVLVGGTGAWFLYQRSLEQTETPPELTEQARTYLGSLDLSDTEMSAKEDALGQTLLEINGKITNNGDRTCELIEVNVIFREVNGLEIDRQRSSIVDSRTGALAPGETQAFRMAFDNIAPAWNQAFPSLFISQIRFAGE
jgi:hypothetical protein